MGRSYYSSAYSRYFFFIIIMLNLRMINPGTKKRNLNDIKHL